MSQRIIARNQHKLCNKVGFASNWKIDRCLKFLNGFDIAKSEKAKYIISSNLQMARLMGMEALAEGVETEEQLEYLKSIGFDKAQGYYFGKPMKLDDVFNLGMGIEKI